MESDQDTAMVPADADVGELVKASSEQLEQATMIAKRLKEFIDKGTIKPHVFGTGPDAKEHLCVEHWQFLGRFNGCSPRTAWTKPLEFAGATGFEARVEVVDDASGLVVGAAEQMCMDDEGNWRNKPMFQLRGMAQTRACARALRQRLGWIAQLAGYEPTPAEEMDGSADKSRRDKLRDRLDAEGIVDKFLAYYQSQGWEGETLEDLKEKHVKQCLNGIETLVKKVHAWEPSRMPKKKGKRKSKPKLEQDEIHFDREEDDRSIDEFSEDEVPF